MNVASAELDELREAVEKAERLKKQSAGALQVAQAAQQAARLQKVLTPTMTHPLIASAANRLSENSGSPKIPVNSLQQPTITSSSGLATSTAVTSSEQVDCKIETILDD